MATSLGGGGANWLPGSFSLAYSSEKSRTRFGGGQTTPPRQRQLARLSGARETKRNGKSSERFGAESSEPKIPEPKSPEPENPGPEKNRPEKISKHGIEPTGKTSVEPLRQSVKWA